MKPHKWGFIIFVRPGVSGTVYDMLPYTKGNTFNNYAFIEKDDSMRFGAKAVLQLCKSIATDIVQPFVFFDNYFCSLPLISYLKKEKRIESIGTIRKTRIQNCPLDEEKILQKKSRGSYDYRTDTEKEVCIVKWCDNKAVTLALSYAGIHPLAAVKRWDKTEKRKWI